MRLTLISKDLGTTSGYGTVSDALVHAFAARDDIDTSILLSRSAPVVDGRQAAGGISYVLPAPVTSFKRRPHKLIPFIFPNVELGETDLIHTVVEFSYAIMTWRIAAKADAPFVVSLHGTYGVKPFSSLLVKNIYRSALRRAAAITAPSRYTADAFRSASGLKQDVSIIHNPVDMSRFRGGVENDGVRAQLGLPPDARIILSVGAIKRRKGFDTLNKAFAEVASEAPDAYLVIAGAGPTDQLRQLAASLGIERRVLFLGRVPGHALTDLFRACDVFALLSRNVEDQFEGFGIVYLEAGACGKPVVGTRSGGISEAVIHGETGLLVEEEDHGSAAGAILRLLKDPALAKSMGEAGRQWAAQHDIPLFGDKLVRIYQEALECHKLRRESGATA